jgi:hypothetical protein
MVNRPRRASFKFAVYFNFVELRSEVRWCLFTRKLGKSGPHRGHFRNGHRAAVSTENRPAPGLTRSPVVPGVPWPLSPSHAFPLSGRRSPPCPFWKQQHGATSFSQTARPQHPTMIYTFTFLTLAKKVAMLSRIVVAYAALGVRSARFHEGFGSFYGARMKS